MPDETPPSASTECDLIMKGGITSGVIYPRAIVELSRKYRFRCVGGSSAGAIAAAGAAAAEYGRQAGASSSGAGLGFEELARLPEELGETMATGESRLRSLFRPSPRTRGLFEVLVRASAGKGLLEMLRRAIVAVLLRPPGIWFLLVAVSCAVLLVIGAVRAACACDVSLTVAFVALVPAWCAVLVLAAVAVFLWQACASLVENGFGICSGFSRGEETAPPGIEPLTTWLDRFIRRLAGIDRPLTLGDLESRGVQLAVTTTSLTNMRPFRLPFHADDPQFYFCEEEFRRLFPGDVVDQLVRAGKAEHATNAEGEARRRQSRAAKVLAAADAAREGGGGTSAPPGRWVPFPRGGGLPVVVAARMSLSFPLLMSAVPLWGVDWRRKGNHRAPRLERVWFSDGGICSNIPIHFFDAALPTRPTFAINLRDADADHPVGAWLPRNNASGVAQRWTRLPEGRGGILAFLGAIVRTMQTWVDETQLVTPGFRDRIAHVFHEPDEGGLNLDMSPGVIRGLAERGAEAGVLLRDEFSWKNHLWVRFRTLENVLQRFLGPAWRAYAPNTQRRSDLDALITEHTGEGSYRLTDAQAACARTVLGQFDQLATAVGGAGADLRSGAPRPTPELRVRPRI